MKILNLYAGIGGNRKLWGNEHDITAVEIDPKISGIYQDLYSMDMVIVDDAHDYLLKHYMGFDFVWSSPPCPSHSTLRKNMSMANGAKAVYPDMKLYEEILFLQGYFKGDWVVENVRSWYKPLVEPQMIQRHYFWSNKIITLPSIPFKKDRVRLSGKNWKNSKNCAEQLKILEQNHGITLPDSVTTSQKILLLRNCVSPEVGKYVFEEVLKEKGE